MAALVILLTAPTSAALTMVVAPKLLKAGPDPNKLDGETEEGDDDEEDQFELEERH